jgi:hypothetical protein
VKGRAGVVAVSPSRLWPTARVKLKIGQRERSLPGPAAQRKAKQSKAKQSKATSKHKAAGLTEGRTRVRHALSRDRRYDRGLMCRAGAPPPSVDNDCCWYLPLAGLPCLRRWMGKRGPGDGRRALVLQEKWEAPTSVTISLTTK